MKRTLTVTLCAAAALVLLSQSLSAIPAFARKHGFNCNMCHVAYPKLNDFGQRFRDNGYQIPGQAGLEKTVFETGIPLAIRTTTGYSLYEAGKGTMAGFHVYGLDLLAAGVLHKNVSFLFVYTPRIDEPAADFRGPGDAGDNPAQLAAVESANLVFSNIIRDKLNLRVGRFEPAYQLLSSKRLYYMLQPFEIYDFAGSLNGFDDSANQLGIEVTGHFRGGSKYALGYVNGNGANPDNNSYKDFYGVLSQTFGRGEGQSAGQRLAVFGYYGWQPLEYLSSDVSPVGDINGEKNKNFYRVGGSLSLNWGTFNLQGMAFRGVDAKEFNPIDLTQEYKFWGGIAQLDWAGLPDNRLVASVLYNWVRPPVGAEPQRVNALSGLVRYYLGSWSAVNVALHAEYTHRTVGVVNPLKENLVTLLVDFDF
jgi:hypothetical protein